MTAPADDVVPFLTALAQAPRIRELNLPRASDAGPAPSPWSPRAEPSRDVAADAAMVAEARREAVQAGRDEGLRETAELRARLRGLVDALVATRAVKVNEIAELAAAAASTAIEAWLGVAEPAVRFAPVVRDWLTGPSGDVAGATATVHPDDADAMRGAIGDAAIAVVTDTAVIPGDVRVRGGEHELVQAWRTRLGDLRDAIAATIVTARDVQEPDA